MIAAAIVPASRIASLTSGPTAADQLTSSCGPSIAASCLLATFATLAALACAARIRAARPPNATRDARATGWTAAAAIAVGMAVWSTQLASGVSCEYRGSASFDPRMTLLSALVAPLASGLGLTVAAANPASARRLLLGGTLGGAGWSASTFLTIAAMRTARPVGYDVLLAGLSVVMNVGTATVLCWVAFRLGDRWRAALLAALLLGAASRGGYYTALAAVRDNPGRGEAWSPGLDPFALGLVTAAGSTIVLMFIVVAAVGGLIHPRVAGGDVIAWPAATAMARSVGTVRATATARMPRAATGHRAGSGGRRTGLAGGGRGLRRIGGPPRPGSRAGSGASAAPAEPGRFEPSAAAGPDPALPDRPPAAGGWRAAGGSPAAGSSPAAATVPAPVPLPDAGAAVGVVIVGAEPPTGPAYGDLTHEERTYVGLTRAGLADDVGLLTPGGAHPLDDDGTDPAAIDDVPAIAPPRTDPIRVARADDGSFDGTGAGDGSFLFSALAATLSESGPARATEPAGPEHLEWSSPAETRMPAGDLLDQDSGEIVAILVPSAGLASSMLSALPAGPTLPPRLALPSGPVLPAAPAQPPAAAPAGPGESDGVTPDDAQPTGLALSFPPPPWCFRATAPESVVAARSQHDDPGAPTKPLRLVPNLPPR